MTEIPDYSHVSGITQPGDNLVAALANMADQQEAAEAEVARLESLLDEAKTNLRRIVEHEIPSLMDGLEGTINLPDGRKVTIAEKIRASVKKEVKPIAMRWLDDNGHGGIVKRQFIIEFGKDQEEWARAFRQQLAESRVPLNVKEERNVQWQTLDAWVREQLAEGNQLPEVFGVFRQRFAKIKSAS